MNQSVVDLRFRLLLCNDKGSYAVRFSWCVYSVNDATIPGVKKISLPLGVTWRFSQKFVQKCLKQDCTKDIPLKLMGEIFLRYFSGIIAGTPFMISAKFSLKISQGIPLEFLSSFRFWDFSRNSSRNFTWISSKYSSRRFSEYSSSHSYKNSILEETTFFQRFLQKYKILLTGMNSEVFSGTHRTVLFWSISGDSLRHVFRISYRKFPKDFSLGYSRGFPSKSLDIPTGIAP